MKVPTTPWRSFGVVLIVLVLVSLQSAFAQIEGAIVANRSAEVHGMVEGSLLLLKEEAIVTVDSRASVFGDLILPAAQQTSSSRRDQREVMHGGDAQTWEVSSRATVNIPDKTAITGKERASKRVLLPRADTLTAPKGTESVVLTARQRSPDARNLKDLTLRSASEGMILPPRKLALPPGAYGNIVIDQGTLMLGTVGSSERTRYSFKSLSVAASGSLVLLGPVVVTTGVVGTLDGRLGSSRYVNWLDLRVLSGKAAIGGRLYGHLTAQDSTVTLRSGSWLIGGLICDHASVETGARFTGVRPSWAPEATGNARPLFIHNAVRFEERVAELTDEWGEMYNITTSYENDVPTIEIVSVRAGAAGAGDNQAFLEMACALFDNARFSTGKMILDRGERSAPLEVTATQDWFIHSVRALAGGKDLRAAITDIRKDPSLQLALFTGRPANAVGTP